MLVEAVLLLILCFSPYIFICNMLIYIYIYICTYGVSQEERSILWEAIVLVILSKKVCEQVFCSKRFLR
jgi:hypothetical protein